MTDELIDTFEDKIRRRATELGVTLSSEEINEMIATTLAIRYARESHRPFVPPGVGRHVRPLHPWLWRHRMWRNRYSHPGPYGSRSGPMASSHPQPFEARSVLEYEPGDKIAAVSEAWDTRRGMVVGTTEQERATLLGPWAALIDEVRRHAH